MLLMDTDFKQICCLMKSRHLVMWSGYKVTFVCRKTYAYLFFKAAQ